MAKPYQAQKVSYTLSQGAVSIAERLGRRYASGNASLMVDVAIKHLAHLDEPEVKRIVAREQAERSVASTRDAWMRAFWQWLAGMFGCDDAITNPYAPRVWNGHFVVFLLKSSTEYPDDKDPFWVSVMPDQSAATNRDNYRRDFARNISPVEAAEEIGHWIQSHYAPVSGVPT